MALSPIVSQKVSKILMHFKNEKVEKVVVMMESKLKY